jgi:hypothetical protein
MPAKSQKLLIRRIGHLPEIGGIVEGFTNMIECMQRFCYHITFCCKQMIPLTPISATKQRISSEEGNYGVTPPFSAPKRREAVFSDIMDYIRFGFKRNDRFVADDRVVIDLEFPEFFCPMSRNMWTALTNQTGSGRMETLLRASYCGSLWLQPGCGTRKRVPGAPRTVA